MNIAFGFDIFYPETNGVISATINLAENLIKMGHNVYFFVPKEAEFTDDVINGGIRIIRVRALPTWIYKGLKIMPIYGKRLLPYIKKNKIDIVHNTSPWLMGMALNHAARRAHIPTIATHHTLIDNPVYMKYALKSDFLTKIAGEAIWDVIFKPFYRLTWMATAPSMATCEQVRSKIDKIDIRYVSNGIDVSRYTSDPDRPIPEAVDTSLLSAKTLIFVGRLGYEKSIDVTIKAFEKAIKKIQDANLLIIGKGPAEHELRNLVKQLGIGERVHFTGMIENSELIGSGILRKCGAFVTASVTENQAMTVIEALCSGLPVIAADVENMRALFDESEGIFFKPGDTDDLAYSMIRMLENKEERDAKARATVNSISRFDGRNVAKEFLSLYEELLKKKEEGYCVPGGLKYVK